jgi:nucleotide-binding universal stress UspA family protein
MAQAFSRILLAFDDSAGSRTALEYACALAQAGATLTVAHAVKQNNFVTSAVAAGFFPPVDPTSMIAAADEQDDSVLGAAIAACAAHGILAEKVFVHDLPAGIMAVARRTNADVIVVGTHGRTGVARTLLGSVAESILRASDVPVLVVSQHVAPPQRDAILQRALVAIDDSDPSEAALALAAHLSKCHGTRLTLCSVMAAPASGAKIVETVSSNSAFGAARSFLLEDAEVTEEIASFVDTEMIVKGDPPDAIEKIAQQRACDVIIVGTHGRHGVRRALEGSVAENLARTSTVPVLVATVRHAAR